jgi:hypothetical protein
MLGWTKKITFLFLLLFSAFSVTAQVEEWMPDATLRQAVLTTLDLSAGVPLTKDKMLLLESLESINHDDTNASIVDITGLEYAKNLRHLDLGGNNNHIQDLRPLSNLTNLKSLHIWHITLKGPVTDLDLRPLTNLVQLEVLSLEGNGITDITPLSHLTKLRRLHLTHNYITDITPLSHLIELRELKLRNNYIEDFSPVLNLPNLVEFLYDEVCDWISTALPVAERIQNRTYPSIVAFWPKGSIEEIARYDFNYGTHFALDWDTTQSQPTHGLATRYAGDVKNAKKMRQQLLQQNPNMLFITELRVHNHLSSIGELDFPEGSDLYLRDSNGQIIRNTTGQYVMNILNRDLQDILIERIVGFSACGIFDGILIDGFLSHGIGHAHYFSFGTPEDHIIAITRILREARARVRDDFLIIVNANFSKPTRYAEFINGSSMEPGADYAGIGGGTYKRLQVLDDTLLWNEKNLREPIFNWAEFFYLPTEPPNSPANEQRMRLATARGLTHSDGYVRLTYKGEAWHDWLDQHNYWHDFWDTDLGRPVGEKGRLYDEDIEGLFIREFTNGWAVYNRSGIAQSVQLPQSIGVASHKNGSVHTVPDLDGEMFLKVVLDLNGDGVINILDLVIIANAFGESEPDLNGDGVVNILDLVIIANEM